MLATKANFLSHGVALLPRFTAARLIHMTSSTRSLPSLNSFVCCQSNPVTKPSAATFVIPKRRLAGDNNNKENFILHENTLTQAEKEEIESSVKKDFEDWIPYGFCDTDKEEDILLYKMFMFSTLTVGLVIFLYLWQHLPPKNMREWATREAFLELDRRQRLGLPLVDKDLIPADQIVLPTLEELGDDYELII